MLFTEPTFLFLFLPVLLALYFVHRGSREHARVRQLAAARRQRPLLRQRRRRLHLADARVDRVQLLDGDRVDRLAAAAHATRGRAPGAGWRSPWPSTWSSSASSSTRTSSPTTSTRCSASLGSRAVDVPPVLLPIGISFFTFHAISYVVDVYRRDATAQKSPVHAALYLLLFPQLIAGPIIRYRDIADQLARRDRLARRLRLRHPALHHRPREEGADRQHRRRAGGQDLRDAVRRALARPRLARHRLLHAADLFRFLRLFRHGDRPRPDVRLPLPRELPLAVHRRQRPGVLAPLAHLAVDVVSRLPLHPARRQPRQPGAPTYRNLVTVFFLCGLWHGASWTFVIWGLWHGAFLVVERVTFTADATDTQLGDLGEPGGRSGVLWRGRSGRTLYTLRRRDGRLGVLPRRDAAAARSRS